LEKIGNLKPKGFAVQAQEKLKEIVDSI